MGEERAGEAEELVSTSMGEARMMTIIYLFEWTLAHMVMAELRMPMKFGPDETKAENQRFLEALVE